MTDLFDGRYVIDREIGRGGSAVVYKAHDEHLGRRQLAIKVLMRTIASQVSVDRFLREVRIAVNLSHPSIVPLYDAGTADELPYFTMPYHAGETLRTRLDRQPQQPLAEAIRITTEVADALEYAHAANIVHCDIKPENILFANGRPIVADFGIAKAISRSTGEGGRARITTEGHAWGTLQYMSPEQQLGDETLDGRSDIYSLATVLYEMLAGAVPFGGRNQHEILMRRITEDPPPIAPMRGDVTAELESVIMRALARDARARYSSAREFSHALVEAAAHAEVPRPVDDRPSIAVIPFEILPPDPEREYLSAGLTDGVISALGRLRRLRVVSRFPPKELKLEPRELGRRLNVDWLVEGTIIRRNEHFRITARLVEAKTGEIKFAHPFDSPAAEAIPMQDEIAESIANELSPSIFDASRREGMQTDPETHRLYLLGRELWRKRAPAAIAKSLQCFQDTVARDPHFARGFAGIADVHNLRYIYGYARPSDLLIPARDAANRAIELDNYAAEPHAALGTVLAVLDYRWDEAAAEFRRAIALDPTYSTAYGWLANYVLLPQGRFDEAMSELEKARAVDPVSSHIGASIGMTHYYARRYEEAVRECDAVLELEPTYLIALYFRGRSLVELGRFDEGIAAFARMSQIAGGHPFPVAETGFAHAKRGDRDAASSEINMLRAMSTDRFVSACLPALIHAALGNNTEALSGFEAGFEEHSTDLLWIGIHPGLEGLRGEPRFREMLRRLRLA